MKPHYLLKPLFVFLLAFITDKIFLLPAVKEQNVLWKKIEPAIYESRDELFRLLQERTKERQRGNVRTGIIFGTSRSGWFSSERIAASIPDTATYNFSVPLAGPAWHYYWLERILTNKIPVSYVIMEADPLLFTRESLEYALSYSFDPLFVAKRSILPSATTGQFTFDEAEEYFLKQLFALYKYPLDPAAIRENRKEIILPDKTFKGYQFHEVFAALVRDANENRNGSIANPFQMPLNSAQMAKDAEDTFVRLGMKGFRPSPTQAGFFREMLAKLGQTGIPVIIFRPPMAPEFARKMAQEPAIVQWDRQLAKMISESAHSGHGSRIIYLDMQIDQRLTCRAFTDASHLSGICYNELADILAAELAKIMIN